jgi:GNAT superfamily N-acetyltransferase
MMAALDLLREAGPPANVLSYATAVRVTATFIPNVFSVPISSNDRVFLPWHRTRPNNRMTMHGVFRDLSERDLVAPPIASNQEFMNRVLWRDRWYTLKAEPARRVIVCDVAGKIASFVNLTIDAAEGELHIDEVATDIAFQGRGLAGALLRFSETLARAMGCRRMSLWSHESVVQMYEKMSFAKTGPSIDCGDEGMYFAMERALGSSKLALAAWRRAE